MFLCGSGRDVGNLGRNIIEYSHDIEASAYVDCIGRHSGAEQRAETSAKWKLIIFHDIISSRLRQRPVTQSHLPAKLMNRLLFFKKTKPV